MENKKTFGLFLTEQRVRAELTQKELAEKLAIGESAVSKWERDIARPDIEMVADLAKIFGISADELINASVDLKRIKEKKEAKYFRSIKSVYNTILFAGFGIALLTCFIVNLAVSHNLTWFFIVLFALGIPTSLLLVPQFIKKRKLLFVPLIFLCSLFLLLGVVNIYSGGAAWCVISMSALVLAYLIIFAPLLIKYEKFPQVIKRHNAVFSLLADVVALLLLLGVVNIYNGGAAWFFTVALPIAAAGLLPVFATAVVITYLHINKCYKTAILISMWLVFFNIINPFINLFTAEKNNGGHFWNANFGLWDTADAITSNIYLIADIVGVICAAAFAVYAWARSRGK